MKKVINNLDDKLTVDQIQTGDLIGVQPHDSSVRFMLTSLPVKDKGLAKWSLVNANACHYLDYGDRRDVVQDLIENGLKNIKGYKKPPQIYVFESSAELYKWLGNIE